jgi:hypothetical protein
MYRRIAFAAADLRLAVGGTLLVWGFVRLHEDIQRLYGVFLGFAATLVGGVQLAGAMNVPLAAAGHAGWRRLRPRWPVITGIVVIALISAGIGMAAAAIISPDPQSGSGPVRESDLPPVPGTVPARPLLIRLPPAPVTALARPGGEGGAGSPVTVVWLPALGRPPQAAARRAGLEVSRGSCNGPDRPETSLQVAACHRARAGLAGD